MNETEIRLECARLTIEAGKAGFQGDYNVLFKKILESLRPPE